MSIESGYRVEIRVDAAEWASLTRAEKLEQLIEPMLSRIESGALKTKQPDDKRLVLNMSAYWLDQSEIDRLNKGYNND